MGAVAACCPCAGKAETEWPRKRGEYRKRTKTNPECCICWWIFIAAMILCILSGLLVPGTSFIPGPEFPPQFTLDNIKRLTHGADWNGNICGVSPNFETFKYMMFCGSPQRVGAFPKYIIEGSTVCVASCPVDATAPAMKCLMPAYHNFTSTSGGEVIKTGGPVPNVETLMMTVTQSVTVQSTYPTEEWGGRFCLPSAANKPLRDLVINGPWGRHFRPLVSIGAIMDAWPLLLLSALVACLLGYLYLEALKMCAGCMIFLSMVLTTLLTVALSLFFLWAVFINTNDATTDYADFNPIMSVYVGPEAKIYSIVTGIVLMLCAAIFCILTLTSMNHVDEMVGLIAASMECLEKSCGLRMFPAFQSLALLALVIVFLLFGLPVVGALGYEDYSNISINGQAIAGLQRTWKKHWYQEWQLYFYLFGLVWIFEFFIQFGHYVVAYAVCSWYFIKGETTENKDQNKVLTKAGMGMGKHVSVRVGGVDANYGERAGSIMDAGGAKVLVVPVGKKGPGLGRNEMELEKFTKGDMPCGALTAGSCTAFIDHLGSIALGAPIIAIWRIPRFFSQCVAGFLQRSSPDPSLGPAASSDPHMQNAKGCLSLVSACLDQVFGKYSKTAFTQIALCGQDGFLDSSEEAFQFLVKSGGSLSYLHGAMFMYEFFASLNISLFCLWMTLIVQDKTDIFNDKTSGFYIEDKRTTAFACFIIAFAVAWSWMSLWNQTADVLIYCVAWNRNQLKWGHEIKIPHHDVIGGLDDYVPQGMRYLIPAYELDPHFEDGLHAHGIGQQGAILAAMEHGAMNHPTSGPDYSSAFAAGHTQMSKMPVYSSIAG